MMMIMTMIMTKMINDDDDDDDDKLIMRQRSDYDETLRRSKMKLPRTLSKLLIESPRLPSLNDLDEQ